MSSSGKSFDSLGKFLRPSKTAHNDMNPRHSFRPVQHRHVKAFGALIFAAALTFFGDFVYFKMGEEGNPLGWEWDDSATNLLSPTAMTVLGWFYVTCTCLIFLALLASVAEGIIFSFIMKSLPRGLYPRWFVPTVLFGYMLRFYCNIIESFFLAQNEDIYALFDNWTKNSLLIDWQSCINKTLSIAPVTGMMLRLAVLYYGYPAIENWRFVWKQAVQLTRPSWWIQHLALIYTLAFAIPVFTIMFITQGIYLTADPYAPEDPTPRGLTVALFHINFITGGIDLFLALCILIVRRELHANDLDRSKLLVTISLLYNFSNYWGMYATRTYIGRWNWVPILQFCVLFVQVSLVIVFWLRNTVFVLLRRRQFQRPAGLEVSADTGVSGSGKGQGSTTQGVGSEKGKNGKSAIGGTDMITGEIDLEAQGKNHTSADEFPERSG